MPKELLVYNDIYSYTAAAFVRDLDAITGDVSIRINSRGGEVDFGWSMLSKMADHKGKKSIKVDGKAESMACYMLCYGAYAEGLDVSTYMLHRAGYSREFESNTDLFTVQMQSELTAINDKLRAALEARVNSATFERISGISIERLFSLEERVTVRFNAEEALAVGLIDKIIQLTPQAKGEILRLASSVDGQVYERVAAFSEDKPKTSTMTPSELRAKYPEAFNEAEQNAVKAERDRVGAWMAFADADPEAVAKGIKDGETLGQTAMAELSIKKFAKSSQKQIEDENQAPVATPEPESKEAKELTEAEKAEAKLYGELVNALGVKEKAKS